MKSNVDQILNTYYNQDKLRLLHTINTTVNSSFIYQTDKITFGKSDYWASPLEFVEKLGGDCEDFAIFKYFTLLKAGIPASDMRIVIAKDHIRDNAHAVLVVNVNDLWYVLDNTTFEIKTTDATKHLQTIYQVNNEGIWIHK